MDTYQQHKNILLQMFSEAIALSKLQGKADLTKRLMQEADRLYKGKLFVVVAGEFKQGKSSLINAFLGEPDLCPDNPDIATCLVSTISYGPEEKVAVLVGEGEKIAPKSIRREEIRDYVMESRNPKNMRQAHMVLIESPNPHLKDGLMLVDSPGTGGLFSRHGEITYSFLPNADAVLFVSDALSPLSVQDLEFVQKIAQQCRRIIFVLTKIDLSSEEDYQAVMEGNRAKLAKVLNCPADEVRIVPVSSSFKLSYLKSQDPNDLTDSNFEALEHELQAILAQRGDILLNRALYALGQATAEMQALLITERETLLHNPQMEEMKQKLLATRERLRLLEGSRSEWRIQLQQGMRSIREKVSYQFQYDFTELRKRLDTYLDTPDLLKAPRTILDRVDEDINQIMQTLDKSLNEQTTKLQVHLQEMTGLSLSPVAVTVRDYTKPAPVSALQLEIQQTQKPLSWWDKTMIGVGRGGVEARGASMIGGIVGGALGLGVDIFTLGATGGSGLIIGAWLGGKVGSLAGYRAGIPRALEQMQAQTLVEARRKIEKHLMPFIEQSRLLCNQTLSEAMERLEGDMVQGFQDFINQERMKSEEVVQIVSEAQKLSQEATNKRLQELTPLLERLERLNAAIEQTAQQIQSPNEPTDDNGAGANV